MKNYDEIVKQAQDSYNRFFKQVKELPEEEEMDINLDTAKIKESIEAAKTQAEAHMAHLNKIKEEIEKKAEEAEAKVFTKEHQEFKQKVSSMYDQYIEAHKRLFNLSVKVAKIAEEAEEKK